MDVSASYAVLGAYASFIEGVTLGGKLQVDTASPRVTRTGMGVAYANAGYGASVDYGFLAANPSVGTLIDQHEIGGAITIPVAEYWSISSNASWDLVSNSWLQVGGGVTYDDGYLVIGANANRTGPSHSSPNATTVTATFRIKAPAGLNLGYQGAVPLTMLPGF